MKIEISKAFQKWQKNNKSNTIMIDAVERFMVQVFLAPDIASVTPQPKSAGKNLRKGTGTVDEFTLSWSYRLYSKCGEFQPGVKSFRLAMGGIKGISNQNDDILTALNLFDGDNNEEWTTWEPTTEQIKEWTEQRAQQSALENDPDSDEETEILPKKPAKKGKPVDENGLTVAERKALRRKENQQKQQQEKEARKKAEQEAAAKAAQEEAAKAAAEQAKAAKKTQKAQKTEKQETAETADKYTLDEVLKDINDFKEQLQADPQDAPSTLKVVIKSAEAFSEALKIEKSVNEIIKENKSDAVQLQSMALLKEIDRTHSMYEMVFTAACAAERAITDKAYNAALITTKTRVKSIKQHVTKIKQLFQNLQQTVASNQIPVAPVSTEKPDSPAMEQQPVASPATDVKPSADKQPDVVTITSADNIGVDTPNNNLIIPEVVDPKKPENKAKESTSDPQKIIFEDVMAMHYELEKVRLQKQITTLQIQIQEYNIQKTKLEIELKTLEMQELQMLMKMREKQK